jgi:UDP-glucose 4-epimerase
MKVLVTGGAGFIGKHLVKSLLKKGNLVTIFDNFSNSEKSSTASLVEMGAKIIEGDITKLESIANAIKDHDIVIHLAAKISVEDSIKNPSETFRINVDGTRNVLVACEKQKVRKLIVASSAAVYGESSQGIKLTENSKINPISPYGESKAVMEQKIREFVSKHNINCVILRFFNIFGVGQSPEYAGVITKFIKRISNNKSLHIYGDGMQTRDFVAVQDIVDAIHKAILYDKNGTYNIASGKSVTIKELAEFMISLSGKNLKIQYVAPKKGDIRHSQADITLAKKELKYSPKVGLEEIKNLFIVA